MEQLVTPGRQPQDEVKNRCQNCPSSENLRKCSACLIGFYCSEKCQRVDWVKHKKICRQQQGILKEKKVIPVSVSIENKTQIERKAIWMNGDFDEAELRELYEVFCGIKVEQSSKAQSLSVAFQIKVKEYVFFFENDPLKQLRTEQTPLQLSKNEISRSQLCAQGLVNVQYIYKQWPTPLIEQFQQYTSIMLTGPLSKVFQNHQINRYVYVKNINEAIKVYEGIDRDFKRDIIPDPFSYMKSEQVRRHNVPILLNSYEKMLQAHLPEEILQHPKQAKNYLVFLQEHLPTDFCEDYNQAINQERKMLEDISVVKEDINPQDFYNVKIE